MHTFCVHQQALIHIHLHTRTRIIIGIAVYLLRDESAIEELKLYKCH